MEQRVTDQITKIALSEAEHVAQEENRFESTLGAAASSIAADEVVVRRPDVFLKIAAKQAELSRAPVEQIINRSAALERATSGFTDNTEDVPPNLSLFAKNPLQKFVAGVVDALPEGTKNAIIAGLAGGAWEKAVDTATRYYGKQVVNEQCINRRLRAEQGLSQNTTGALQSVTNGASKFLRDITGMVFQGSMDEATVRIF